MNGWGDSIDAAYNWQLLSILLIWTVIICCRIITTRFAAGPIPAPRPRLMIPFDDEGRLLTIPSIWRNPIWLDNFEFSATFSVCGFGGVADEQSRWYMVFDHDMRFILANATAHQGEVSGVWTFCTRGGRFGIRLIRPAG